jgi:hypothetical protein
MVLSVFSDQFLCQKSNVIGLSLHTLEILGKDCIHVKNPRSNSRGLRNVSSCLAGYFASSSGMGYILRRSECHPSLDFFPPRRSGHPMGLCLYCHREGSYYLGSDRVGCNWPKFSRSDKTAFARSRRNSLARDVIR